MLLWKKRRKRRRRGQRHLSAIMLESAFTCCGRLFSTCRHTKMGLHISQSWSQVEMGEKLSLVLNLKQVCTEEWNTRNALKLNQCISSTEMQTSSGSFLFSFPSFEWFYVTERGREFFTVGNSENFFLLGGCWVMEPLPGDQHHG